MKKVDDAGRVHAPRGLLHGVHSTVVDSSTSPDESDQASRRRAVLCCRLNCESRGPLQRLRRATAKRS